MKEVQFVNWMKRMFHLCMAALLLMMLCMFSSAMAAEKAATVTLNVTNTPVRGDVLHFENRLAAGSLRG